MIDKHRIIDRINNLNEEFLDHLNEIVDRYEEQHNKFMEETSGENNFQVILRAHLYIEFEMKELLHIKLKHPQELGEQVKFSDTLRISLAIGAIPLELKNAISYVNRIRNKFAHDLNYQFNEATHKKFIDNFSNDMKNDYLRRLEKNIDNGFLTTKLKEALFTVWFVLIDLRLVSDEIRVELKNLYK
ncbi:hypothetical protein ACFFNY_20870 [Paenibacillus hodogayensis]|uniref:DUF4145 domain-containing protein n=1 Tax=Paenibacillus hodogayensis TaxID=279208 RepID=A0ABV5W0E4_9BACL